MDFAVKVIADSLAENGRRLTTITATYPRFIHAEVMTHRDRARNAASSRAIPFKKMVEMVKNHPVIPIKWGAEQSGMQTGGELDFSLARECRKDWLFARDCAVHEAELLHAKGLHKSICNRLLEPWAWITVVMTATEWANFFRLRCHQDAEIHFQKIACMIRDTMQESKPNLLADGEWHLPFIQPDEYGNDIEVLAKASTARCARVSYLTHEGTRDIGRDLELFDKLCQGSGFGHWSPHEHIAKPAADAAERSGPFIGWQQYRKSFPLENLAG